jgi:hypothetical protein
MLPFGVTIPATVPQGSEIPEGLMNNPVHLIVNEFIVLILRQIMILFRNVIPNYQFISSQYEINEKHY